MRSAIDQQMAINIAAWLGRKATARTERRCVRCFVVSPIAAFANTKAVRPVYLKVCVTCREQSNATRAAHQQRDERDR